MPNSNSARLFIYVVVLSGFSFLADALAHPGSDNRVRFVSFLLVACLAARLRVKLPGVTGIMSVNLPFILLAMAQMNEAEALVVACCSTFLQCLPRAGKKFNWVQAIFNVGNMALTVEAARLVYSVVVLNSAIKSHPLLLGLAGAAFFIVNTVPVAIIIALTENRNAVRAWLAMFQLSFPYYLGSAGVAGVALTVSTRLGWEVPLFVLPLMLGVFYSYKRYFSVTAAVEAENRRPVQSAAAAPAAS
jgi:hypothetical protein